MTTLYEELKASGAEIDNHESDLYTPATPEAWAIIKRHKGIHVRRFTDETTGKPWIEVAFAYDPFWIKMTGKP